MMVNAVIVGGTDTTRNQLGCAVGLLTDHPDQWKLLAERPEIAPNAVEELMRYFGAVRGTGRFASEHIVYRDLLFPAGTFVFPSLSTANFDGTVFDGPDTLDITREPVKQHPQMTFGSGIHYCLGASLARAELHEPSRSSPAACRTSRSTARSNGSRRRRPSSAQHSSGHVHVPVAERTDLEGTAGQASSVDGR